MHHPVDYADALKCIRNRRYTPAASFMVESMAEKAADRKSPEEMMKLTIAAARKLRSTHTRLLMAQSGGVALRAMAEQAYQDVEGEMAAKGKSKASAPATAGARP